MAELSKQLCNILCNDTKAIEEVKKIRDRLSNSGKSLTEAENILTRTLLPELKPLLPESKPESLFLSETMACTSAKEEPAILDSEKLLEMFKKFKKQDDEYKKMAKIAFSKYFVQEYEPKPFFPVRLTEKDNKQFKMSTRMRFGIPLLSDYETIRKPCRRHKKRRINKKLVKKYGIKYIEFKRKRVPLMFSCLS